MNKNLNTLVIMLVALILGFLVAQQLYLQKKVAKLSEPQNISDLSFQVLELSKSNDDSKKEISKLEDQKNLAEKSLYDRATALDTLEKDMKNYQMIAGQVEIYGPGVQIRIDKKMKLEQMVDLLNAIKNIGADGIAINSRRIVFNQGVSDSDFSAPYKIEVIGDADLLFNALSRKGGALDEIVQGQVEKKDLLILPAIQ